MGTKAITAPDRVKIARRFTANGLFGFGCGIALDRDAEIPAHGTARHERFDQHYNRARNIALSGLPTSNGSTAFDTDKFRETLRREIEGGPSRP